MLLLFVGLGAACGGETSLSPPTTAPATAPASAPEASRDLGSAAGAASLVPVRRAADGSLRVPFAHGELATWSSQMPRDLEQLSAGRPTDHPVVVWAGQGAVPAERAGRAEPPPAPAPGGAWFGGL